MDLKIFVAAPESLRLERRLRRDVLERGRTPEGVQTQFRYQVAPMHAAFVEPSRSQADLIVDGHEINQSSVEVVLAHLQHTHAIK